MRFRSDAQDKMGDMFNDAVKLVPNFATTYLPPVLLRLQHIQLAMHYLTQPMSALHTKPQSNQPATFLAAKFDESLYE